MCRVLSPERSFTRTGPPEVSLQPAKTAAVHDPRRNSNAWREAKPYYPRLALATPLGTLAALTLVPPWAFGDIVNKVLTPKHPDMGVLYSRLALTFAAMMIANVSTYSQTYITAWSGQHLIARLRVRLFERLLHLRLADFDSWRPGELLSRFSTDLAMMTDAVSVSLPQLVVAVVTFFSSLAAMIYLDWFLTLALVVVAPVVSFAVSNFQRLITSATHGAQGSPTCRQPHRGSAPQRVVVPSAARI